MKPNFANIIWHSPSLCKIYFANRQNPRKIREELENAGALDFTAFASGLFPASNLPHDVAKITGMGDAWVRDSVMVAAGLLNDGRVRESVKTVESLITIFANSAEIINKIMRQPQLAGVVENCPPARVDGATLAVHRKHHNAQNDSIGETLWLVTQLISRKIWQPNREQWEILKMLAEYLIAIEFWRFADNGCWEEEQKVEASSVGAALAGLVKYREVATKCGEIMPEKLDSAIEKAQKSLDEILPNESREPFLRDVDAAQIFLIEPLEIVDEKQAAEIVKRISRKLTREIGIIRYENDSYWAPNYREHYSLAQRAQYADDREKSAAGGEAQWTLFDPLLAIYFLKKSRKNGSAEFCEMADWHLARSLAQFVDTAEGWRLPEAYFCEGEKWVANDHVPLLWSQANVLRMLNEFAKNAR